MTEPTAETTAELSSAIDTALRAVGDNRRTCIGFMVTPAEMIATMVVAGAGADDRDAVRLEVERLGGMPGLIRHALNVETWMQSSLGLSALGRVPKNGWKEYGGHPLFERFRMDRGKLSMDRLPMRKVIGYLSAEVKGVHYDPPEPTGRWRRRLVAMLNPMLEGVPTIGDGDVWLEGDGYQEGTKVRGNHPLLAEVWEVYGMRSLEHLPDDLLQAAAGRIALVLRRVHEDTDRLSVTVRLGRQILRDRLANEMGPVPGVEIVVGDTRIHMAHVGWQQGSMEVSHYNSMTSITLPGHTLTPETVTTDANISGRMEFHNVRKYELNLRERGKAMRGPGMTVSTLLGRLMRRDGVDRDAVIRSMHGEDAIVPTARMREMGFASDVSKIEARNGVVDCHLKLGKGVVYRRGRIHATRTDLPVTIKDTLMDGPLDKLVEHPMLEGAIITSVTSARTGSLIVGTQLRDDHYTIAYKDKAA